MSRRTKRKTTIIINEVDCEDVLFKKISPSKVFGLDAWFGTVGAATHAETFGLDAVFRYKVKLPTPLAITLDGRLVIPIRRDIWIGETSSF